MTTTGHRRVRRVLGTSALVLVATLGLAGCGGDSRLGAAAVVNGNVTTVDELQQDTRDYLKIVPGADAGAAQVAILQRIVITEVLEEVARQNDVHVRPRADRRRARQPLRELQRSPRPGAHPRQQPGPADSAAAR